MGSYLYTQRIVICRQIRLSIYSKTLIKNCKLELFDYSKNSLHYFSPTCFFNSFKVSALASSTVWPMAAAAFLKVSSVIFSGWPMASVGRPHPQL